MILHLLPLTCFVLSIYHCPQGKHFLFSWLHVYLNFIYKNAVDLCYLFETKFSLTLFVPVTILRVLIIALFFPSVTEWLKFPMSPSSHLGPDSRSR